MASTRQDHQPFMDGNIIRGRVVDVQTTTKVQGRSSKAIALLFDGEPIQPAHQTTKTTIFVEPLDSYSRNGTPGSQRAMVFYGDINGQVARGNTISAKVKRGRGGMLRVCDLNNETTQTSVRPTTQMTGVSILVATLLTLALLLGFVGWFVRILTDGTLLNFIGGLAAAIFDCIGPILVVLLGIWLLFRSAFRK